MPKPLDHPTEKVMYRVWPEDAELLRILHPGEASAVVRALVHLYCERERAKLADSAMHRLPPAVLTD